MLRYIYTLPTYRLLKQFTVYTYVLFESHLEFSVVYLGPILPTDQDIPKINPRFILHATISKVKHFFVHFE